MMRRIPGQDDHITHRNHRVSRMPWSFHYLAAGRPISNSSHPINGRLARLQKDESSSAPKILLQGQPFGDMLELTRQSCCTMAVHSSELRSRVGETSMDLLQLEHFLAVAEEGSFTRAAERV